MVKAYGINHAVAPQEIHADAQKIRQNPLLGEIYRDVYARIVDEIPAHVFPHVLEVGSGGGFFKEFAPRAITSECVEVEGIDQVVDACRIEDHYNRGSLDAIAGFNVFHHLPDVTGFLRGASQVLREGGRIVLVEPWFTPIGQWFYRILHHEPWIRDPNTWEIRNEGRLAGANSRLPTSVFRDSGRRFAQEFPDLRIVKRQPFHKWLYLLSGGLRLNTRIPKPIARSLVRWDRRIRRGDNLLGIFATIVVERASTSSG